jgi:RHS repeat-associated protein
MTAPSTTLRCQYRYDPLDRLVHQTQPDTPVHQRFYCKSRLATEIQGATKHSIIQHDDLLLAQQQHESNALDTTLLATDLQRSVLHTLKKGLPPRPIAYSPYGHRPVFSALLSLLGFNGERPDPVTGCYLLGNGYRAFNTVLMRFNSPDSLSPFGKGGFNAYAYCGGDPRNRTDPTGHSFLAPLLKKILIKVPNMIDDVDIQHMQRKLTKIENGGFKHPETLETSLPTSERDLISLTAINQNNKISKLHTDIQTLLDAPEHPGKVETLEKMIAKGDRRSRTLQLLEKYTPTKTDSLIQMINNRITRQTELKQLLLRNHPPSYESLFPTTSNPTNNIRN